MSTHDILKTYDNLLDIDELDDIERAASASQNGGVRFLASPALVLRLVSSYRHALDAWLTSDVEALEAADVNAGLASRLHETRCALAEMARLVASTGDPRETLDAVGLLASEALAADDAADDDMNDTTGLSYDDLRGDAWAPSLIQDNRKKG
jgi:hypothetical protein